MPVKRGGSMYISGITSFLVESCGDYVSWHDSSLDRECSFCYVVRCMLGDDFWAPEASLAEILSKCKPLHSFSFQVRFMLVDFCQRRHGILKTHCFGPCGWRQVS